MRNITEAQWTKIKKNEKRENFRLNLGTFVIGLFGFWIPFGLVWAVAIYRIMHLSQ
jgi:hypothetical protein